MDSRWPMKEKEMLDAKSEECSELKVAVRDLVRENQILKTKLFELTKRETVFCSHCGNRVTGDVCRECDPGFAEESRRRHAMSQENVRAKKELHQEQARDKSLRFIAGVHDRQ